MDFFGSMSLLTPIYSAKETLDGKPSGCVSFYCHVPALGAKPTASAY